MELLHLPLMAMGIVFILMPYLAFVPAVLFGWGYFLKRRGILLVAALLWAAYGIYEMGMMLRILCGGECNIRIDLMLIYPLLVLVSIAAIISFLRSRSRLKS